MTEDDLEVLTVGLADMITKQAEKYEEKLAAMAARISILETTMLGPVPEETGLPDPNTLQYLALSFFDNSAEMKRGKIKLKLKIEANRMKKSGRFRTDYSLTAAMFDYVKFRKSFRLSELESLEGVMSRIAPLAKEDNLLFGMVRKQGGPAGTAVFADQLIILETDGASNRPKIICGHIFVGATSYQVNSWDYVDHKTKQPFAAANLTSKARCWPSNTSNTIEDDDDAE